MSLHKKCLWLFAATLITISAWSQQTFTNPLLPSGADPFSFYKDGYYYYTHTTGRNVTLWKTKNLSDLKTAAHKVIFTPPANTMHSREIWAPEIHFIDGKWYAYFAADDGQNKNHRLYVVENASADPMQGDWTFKGKVADPADKWAIDGHVFAYRQQLYMVWSGWQGDENGQQDIFIAKMKNPWTIEGNRVRISAPRFDWETVGDLHDANNPPHVNVNEGPQSLMHDNKLFIVYSASGCWTDQYTLGLLSFEGENNLLDSAKWKKHPQPLFKQNPENGVYAPGHNSFFKSPDGREDWILYHANSQPGQGCGRFRSPRAQKFSWTSDGLPYFGEPVKENTPLEAPSNRLSQFDLSAFDKASGVSVNTNQDDLLVQWPAGEENKAIMRISLDKNRALIRSLNWQQGNNTTEIVNELDPVFLLTVGKRDLVSQNGWNIFFDKVHLKPYQTHSVEIDKKNARVITKGASTIISIDEISAPGFKGRIEITLYSGSPLFNIAAVMNTGKDSTAIVYDAGLVSRAAGWDRVSWSNTEGELINTTRLNDTAKNEMVKYRTIIGHSPTGSLAIFPAPHQYFYPLDEAFNLRFVWHGHAYRKMVDGHGLGIRQELNGDNRYVPWFNAPPGTEQRMNFFCLLSPGDEASALQQVKKFTNNDRYVPLPGYKTLGSHFHNEFIMKVVMAGKPIPDTPNFVKVFKDMGVDIVHLAEFHYTAHPKGPDSTRLKELHALFGQCRRLSDKNFLLLPGEEPNEFLGGHWLQFFPKPIYWIMSRKPGQPFVSEDPKYGRVYRVGNAAEMLDLLNREKGLAWTAHPRTKGSVEYPDKYKNEKFFLSDRFLGAAWKAMPADLSQPRLGKRVLDLQDDMNNWGVDKKVLAESDLFTIEPENEMYAHMNVNYIQLDRLPSYDKGWQPVLDALRNGKFFSGTGEVLIPRFKLTGSTATFDLQWTFPLNFAELISGDGRQVYRQRINLDYTRAFGKKSFTVPAELRGRKWVRLEVWDVAANGAFTQTIWITD